MKSAATLAALTLIVFSASTAAAHEAPYSYLDLERSSAGVSGRYTAHVFDLAHELGISPPDSLLEPGVAQRLRDSLVVRLAPRFSLETNGATHEFTFGAVRVDADRSGLAFEVGAPIASTAGAATLRALPFPYDPEHELFVTVRAGEAVVLQDILTARRSHAELYATGARGILAVLRTFVPAGIHHIFIGPDHILFVIALLLPGGGLRRLFGIVTAFTLAHSVTLALATFGIVNPPGAIVEPAIALSIVAVGLSNLWRGWRRDPRLEDSSANAGRDPRHLTAFAFGLIHGFGFASVLRDFGLPAQALGTSLLGFNLGVEVGQACIVSVAAPLLMLARRANPRAARVILIVGSIGVTLAGIGWLIERLGALR
ncbi:MAG: HupE/UreJ family protein [Candidatus Eisenbacteria bacterium]|uniref:HupE/UreJ family protein n=1 Tax=Eiseniibacteriota bacterium TaxID=2212470 RepID=A0A849SRE8_UNCEI|nr:HupE/UreJ family protein [Candidatus Eisenbacteria bacterium]